MKEKFIAGLFILVMNNGVLYAQKNDSLSYYTNLSTTGNYNRTNQTRSYLFANSLIFAVKKEDIRAHLNTRWLYGKQQGNLSNNDFSNSFDLNLYKTFPGFYYWALLTYNRIYSLKINEQFQAGAGVAYNLIDKKNVRLNISDGILYEYGDIYEMDTVRTFYTIPRNSFRLQFRIEFAERFSFVTIGYFQNSLTSKSDYIIKNENTILIKLKKWLSLNGKFTYDRTNRTNSEALFMTYGLTFEKSF